MEVDRNHSMSVWVDTTTPTASTGSVLVHLEKYLNVLEAVCCIRDVLCQLDEDTFRCWKDVANPSPGECSQAWAPRVCNSTEKGLL